MRAIDADALEGEAICLYTFGGARYIPLDALKRAKTIEVPHQTPASELPCKIGDTVWCIRNFHGHKHPQKGIVSEMFFTKDMKLQIVVKYVARGIWGKTVFLTREAAEEAIKEE